MNYDRPEAFETELLLDQLSRLQRGESAQCPGIRLFPAQPVGSVSHSPSKRVILVEGILVFADQRLRDMFDIKIFVEADADERFCGG